MTSAITVLIIAVATTVNAFVIMGLQGKTERLETKLKQLERRVG